MQALANTSPSAEEQPDLDVKMQPLNYHSIFDLLRISIGEASYVAKVYPAHLAHLHAREAQLLAQLAHPAILRPLPAHLSLPSRLASLLKADLLLFPQALRGDLQSFVRRRGAVSEVSCKWVVKRVVEAMQHCFEKTGSYHPNLQLDNLLLDDHCNLLLCGWTNSQQLPPPTLPDLLFQLTELAFNLLTSRTLFISRDSRTDPYAKFLSAKHIHKLFQQVEKVTKKIVKDFTLSPQLIDFATPLFLKQATSLQTLKESEWLKSAPTLEQVQADIQAQEDRAKLILKERREKEREVRGEESQLMGELKEEAEPTLHRTSSRCDNSFLEEYLALDDTLHSFPPKTPKMSAFPLFTSDLRHLLAHLRAHLRRVEKQEEEPIVDPLLQLQEWEVSVQAGVVRVECWLGWNFDLVEAEAMAGKSMTAEVKLFKEGDQLWGRVEVTENGDLSEECVHRLRWWVQEVLAQHT